jgi:hypothetical protein
MPLNCLKAPIAVDPSRGISGPSLLCHSSVGWPLFEPAWPPVCGHGDRHRDGSHAGPITPFQRAPRTLSNVCVRNCGREHAAGTEACRTKQSVRLVLAPESVPLNWMNRRLSCISLPASATRRYYVRVSDIGYGPQFGLYRMHTSGPRPH